jgi:hypothetical protein
MPTIETLAPEAIVEQLRTLRSQIPEYVQLPTADAQSLRRAANVDANFVQASINAVTESARVAAVLGRSAADLRQETVDADRWTTVEDELRAMLNGVAAANLVRRHRIGLTALQTYNICRQLVRQKEHSALLPHVQGMKRLNKFGKKHAKTPAEPNPPQPAA